MITRTLRGLLALLVVATALIGWPAALLALADAVAVWLPDLSDPAGLLSRPDTGGLFLVIVLGLGWIAWAVWTIALLVEVAAQVRGVPTPHLGGLFPQNAATALITTIAVAFTLAPTAPALATTPGTTATPATATATATGQATADPAPPPVSTPAPEHAADEDGQDYTVVRGDTLWDIADDQLDDPTRWPEIAEDSQPITQPDGRHLTDPDLILPGWTLSIPDTDQPAEPAQAATPEDAPTAEVEAAEGAAPSQAEDSPASADPVLPPMTPMQSPDPRSQDPNTAAGVFLPSTPLAGPAAQASTPTGDGPELLATGPADPVTRPLPGTPMGASGEPPADPTGTGTAREAGYDDEGRFAPTHGVLGLPNWITAPLIPTRPEDAPELLAEAEAILARYSAAQAADRAAGGLPATPQRKAT